MKYVYCEDYCRDNRLKCLCHSCQDQNKGITQKNTLNMGWGKMKDVKKIKGLNWAFGKIVRWKKIIRKSQEEKQEKQ